ncbi:hypothetical protein [Bradyrhizobium neotropicale]|uniref:hypothetical protein n=1 Tax=Bradyrhizobium neotropicale TaxID=1497615 RepID=UPI001AD66557|nr:hypothetical protein [Bradyrhizobium neotropicale]MBO4221982.1 hypothetical protein [Bradyrhizobium neotropicale]
MKHTAGVWDRSHWPLYFMAANPETLQLASLDETDNLLMAVNEVMTSKNGLAVFEELCRKGRKIFLDSGVYWLATQHAKATGMTMNEALSLAPAHISGFNELLTTYVDTVRRHEATLWGYIEIDQGGRDNKTRTRTRLEDMGLRPIPVYHPLNDGWDYFDELASQYDRICLGNVVMARPDQRKRLVATLWERRQQYPHLWIHALGLTPSDLNVAYPIDSCDSSSWISSVRWGRVLTSVAGRPFGDVEGFVYSREADSDSERGHRKARRLCAYNAIMTGNTMRNIRHDQENELGADTRLPHHG